jgi:multidrug resistance efflux pump
VFVTANFTERQITNIHPGSARPFESMRSATPIRGKVAGIHLPPSQVSLAPADTHRNFTKIVQRIPVKIVSTSPNARRAVLPVCRRGSR